MFKPGVWIIIAFVAILAFFSCYTIKETERGMVLTLGRIVADKEGVATVMQPGLHVKWPFISNTSDNIGWLNEPVIE